MSNFDPKKNPITTLLGSVFVALGLGPFVAPWAGIVVQMENWQVYAFLLAGVGLLLIPDDIIKALKKIVARKSKDI